MNPEVDVAMANNAGKSPLARMRGIFLQGEAIIERSLPKYLSPSKAIPSLKTQAFVHNRKALPMTQLVRLVVLKL